MGKESRKKVEKEKNAKKQAAPTPAPVVKRKGADSMMFSIALTVSDNSLLKAVKKCIVQAISKQLNLTGEVVKVKDVVPGFGAKNLTTTLIVQGRRDLATNPQPIV